ncbi:MAG TPA: non-canonical purine NTP pyrophosphatase, RdgB/HAM1 family [Cytophagales bacterium]|jgi:XTP/dITP diphosphohydrolase|nr:non-canonical purine NTP pyrophosphatase, RdgB/HAM1 family [Cytophagales bacterium]
MKLCFATNNQHKIEEVKSMLLPSIDLMSLSAIGCKEELAETTGTIAGNSHQKAEYVFRNYKVNCFADDSGLEVEALNGLPGVDSAIYAGSQRSHSDNISLLLKNLQGIKNRKARFITVITLFLNGAAYQFEGILNGSIGLDLRGENGFGYDPVFIPDGFCKTLAEMTMDEKNKISHRARAIEKLVKFIIWNPEFSRQ